MSSSSLQLRDTALVDSRLGEFPPTEPSTSHWSASRYCYSDFISPLEKYLPVISAALDASNSLAVITVDSVSPFMLAKLCRVVVLLFRRAAQCGHR